MKVTKLLEDWRVKAVLAVLAAAAVIAFLVAQIPEASAADVQKWKEWGAAPYATSQEEACRKLPAAIDGFKKMPMPVKEHFKTELGTTCEGGVETLLLPDDLLEEMWSGGAKPHVMSKIAVEEIPVAKSPEGRPYPKGSVVQAVKVFQWEYTYEGKKYVLSTPLVCFNWAWAYGAEPLPEPPLIAKPAVAPAGMCPGGWKLSAKAFSLSSPEMPEALRKNLEKHIIAAKGRDSQEGEHLGAYQTDAVSRTHGAELLAKVPLAPVTTDIRVRFIDRDPETKKLRFQEIGTLKIVNGSGTFSFVEDPRGHDAVGTTWPTEQFISPELSGPARHLERKIRVDKKEWTRCHLFVSGVTE